jgi:hypothetical protein
MISYASEERYLRRDEAANYVRERHKYPCSRRTLAKKASEGSDGPPFLMCGRFPYYPVSGLDRWAVSKRGPLVRSTAEARGVGQSEKKTGQAAERETVISTAAQHSTT